MKVFDRLIIKSEAEKREEEKLVCTNLKLKTSAKCGLCGKAGKNVIAYI